MRCIDCEHCKIWGDKNYAVFKCVLVLPKGKTRCPYGNTGPRDVNVVKKALVGILRKEMECSA